MRRFNAVLSALILLLFLIHAVMGGFQLLGVSDNALKRLAWITAALIVIHTAIGVKLTADTLRAGRASGAWYFRENLLFWARRISGFAIFVLLFFHLTAFSDRTAAVLRLKDFGGGKLAVQLLLVASLAAHVLMNVRPMCISFGVPGLKRRSGELWFVLSVLLLFMAAALIVYYLRWNVW